MVGSLLSGRVGGIGKAILGLPLWDDAFTGNITMYLVLYTFILRKGLQGDKNIDVELFTAKRRLKNP